MLKDNALIERFVNRLLELQGEDSFDLRLLQKQLAEIEKGIENMLNTIQVGVFLDNLELLLVLHLDLMSRNTVLLFLTNDGLALFLRKVVAGFPLHGDVCLTFIVIVHLLAGGHPVKTIDSVFHALFYPF